MKPIKTQEWTPRKRSQVLRLTRGGRHSVREIARILNMPPSTVHNIQKHGVPDSKPKMGRPRTLTARDKRRIELYIKKSKETHQEAPDDIIKTLSLSCSRTALINAIHELGYHRCVGRRRPLLKKIDYKHRLDFARKYKNWTVEDWKRVIFTDEISIKIGMDRLCVMWVWRKPGEEFHQDCVDLRKRSTGSGMMFWGAFRMGKIGLGLFFELEKGQKITSKVYRDQVLLGSLKTFVDKSRNEISEPIIMEDNASVHKGVCKEHRQTLKWPTYEHSPNSIENIWAWMKHQITRHYRHITSQKEMKRITLEL
jgi:transposase